MFLSIIISCCLVCVKSLARSVPINYFLLFTFTACESIIVAYICSLVKNPEIVLTAVCLTAAIVLALTLYAFTTDSDFTTCGAFAFIVGALFLLLGLFSIFMGPKFYMVYCFFGVLLFGFYLIIDIQLIVGGKAGELKKDDYIIGAMMLYLDIINIFLYIV